MSISITWDDDAGAAQLIKFDSDQTEEHELTNEVTMHPIESGSDVADHIRPNLDVFTIEGFVSDSPLASNFGVDSVSVVEAIELQIPSPPSPGVTAPGRALVGGINSLVAGALPTKATVLRFPDFKSRVRIVLETLDDIRINARLCRIITKAREYDDMALASIAMSRGEDDGEGARFTLRFQQVKFVESETVNAPVPAESLGALKNAAGSLAPKPPDDGKRKEELRKTLAKQMKDGLLDALGGGGFL